MKALLSNYFFYPNSGFIHFPQESGLLLENFLLVTNASTNQIVYNFADPTMGGSISGVFGGSGNALKLVFTGVPSMNSGNRLQVFYERDGGTPVFDRASGYLTGYLTGSGGSTGLYAPVVPVSFSPVGGRAVDLSSGFAPDYKRNEPVSLNFDKEGGGLLSYQADLDKDIDSVTSFDPGFASASNYSVQTITGNPTGSFVVVSGNYNRQTLFLQNLGTNRIYAKYGAGATDSSFSFILFPGQANDDGLGEKMADDKYRGDLSVNAVSGQAIRFIAWEGV
jgi:hypothetical protein